MALEFKLPDIGEGIAEGEIVKWLVKEGDLVKEHQSIVEVMTDKATVEVPAPAAGQITELRAKEGDTVPVGSVIFVLETGAGGAKQPLAAAAKAPAAPAKAASQPAAAAAKSAASPARPGTAPARPAAEPARPSHAAVRSTQEPVPARASHTGASKNEEQQWEGGSGPRLEFKLPDIGEGIAEGEIVKWLVKEGDLVKEHQSIVEVMTDKATVEVPAPAAGRITRILVAEGSVVPVGSVIFHLEGTGAAPVAAKGAAPSPAREAPRAPIPRGHEPARRASEPAHARQASDGNGRGSSRVLAVPSARRVARELGIDLSEVPGTGPHGVVRRTDVEEWARGAGSAPAAPAREERKVERAPATPKGAPVVAPRGDRESTRTPFRGVRRKISEAMVRSKFTAPHFTVVEEVDVTELVALREKAKAIGAESGVKITFMPFVMKATAIALAKYPSLNGMLDEEAQELVRFHYVDLGIAMDTDNGLIVPVVRDVQAKGLLQLGAELAELAERTRAGKVKPEELRDSTFSITNAGNIGGTLATPIINFPNIAILGVHRIMKKPGVVETPQGDRIEVRQYMNFSCSVDHRLADGADAARFLVHLKKLLENPGLLAL